MASGALAVLGALIAVIAWFELRGPAGDIAAARTDLTAVVNSSTSLTSQAARADAVRRLETAAGNLARAQRGLRRSWTLKVARQVPFIRSYANATRTLTDGAAEATAVTRGLLARVSRIAVEHPLANGTVPLDALGELATEFRASAAAVEVLRRPPTNLWGRLGDASAEFRRLQRDAPDRLRNAAGAMDAGRAFLGQGGPRTYVIAGQNNAEMRDQGMVLSYAVITADRGRLAAGRRGRITDLAVDQPVDTTLPSGTEQVFGPLRIRRLWQSANAMADFRISGRLMQSLYRASTGQAVDGVIALDVPALSRILTVTGPVSVPGLAAPVSSANAIPTLLHDLYNGVPAGGANQDDRYERIGDVIGAVVSRLTTGNFDQVAAGSPLGQAAQGGHVRAFAADPDVQRALERSGISGAPDLTLADRTFHVSVQNATTAKLDYFVRPRIEADVTVEADGAAVVRTTVTVANPVPLDAAPSYQLGPNDPGATRPGEYAARVYLYAPRGAVIDGGVAESGLVVAQQGRTVVNPASEQRFVFVSRVPNAVRNGRLTLRFVPQPRVEPVPLRVRLGLDGRRVKDGDATQNVVLDRTLTLTWGLS